MKSLLSLSNRLFGYVCIGSVTLVLSLIPNEDARSATRSIFTSTQVSTRTSFALFNALRASVSFPSFSHDIIHLTSVFCFCILILILDILVALKLSSIAFYAIKHYRWVCIWMFRAIYVWNRYEKNGILWCKSNTYQHIIYWYGIIDFFVSFLECLNSDMELKRQAIKEKVLTYLSRYSRQNMNEVDIVYNKYL